MTTIETPEARQRIVVADMDETVISVKSMLRFANFVAAEAPAPLAAAAASTLAALSRTQAQYPRKLANSLYFTMFSGFAEDALSELGRQWFELESANDSFYHKPVVEALREHQAHGADVWLITGSLRACAAPVAEDLGLTGCICTPQRSENGILTGEISRSLIGRGKAAAAIEAAAPLPLDQLDIWAYADHHTDLAMLSLADHAVCVNPDPPLESIAQALGWRIWNLDSRHVKAGADL